MSRGFFVTRLEVFLRRSPLVRVKHNTFGGGYEFQAHVRLCARHEFRVLSRSEGFSTLSVAPTRRMVGPRGRGCGNGSQWFPVAHLVVSERADLGVLGGVVGSVVGARARRHCLTGRWNPRGVDGENRADIGRLRHP